MTTPPPLCVDLDGTLLLGDAAVESALMLLKRNPLYLFAMLWWASRGWSLLKHEVARRAPIDITTLPWNQQVLDWIRAEREHRACLLVTASDILLAKPIAKHLGCFDDVMASDGDINLAGANKADALVERFGDKGFDYIGNSYSDLAVWVHARHAIIANASPQVIHRAGLDNHIAKIFPRHGQPDPGEDPASPPTHRRDRHPVLASIPTWARALRLHHWSKNLLLLAPLVGAHQIGDPGLLATALLAWLLFGLCTSGTYLLNDLMDLPADRHHPDKRRRPLASGRLNLPAALTAAPLLIGVALAGAAALLSWPFTAWMAAYLVLTLAYSWRLKRVIILDTVVLAGLFTVRILAGSGATGIPASAWLLTLSMLLFFGLALLKRYTELQALRIAQQAASRGRGYRRSHLGLVHGLGIIAGIASVATVGLYVASPAAAPLYARPAWLWALCPLLAAWLIRLWWLAKRGRMHEDPVMFASHDLPSWIILILGALTVWGAA